MTGTGRYNATIDAAYAASAAVPFVVCWDPEALHAPSTARLAVGTVRRDEEYCSVGMTCLQ